MAGGSRGRRDQDRLLDILVNDVVQLLDDWTLDAEEIQIITTIEALPDGTVDRFLEKLRGRTFDGGNYLEKLFDDVDGARYDQLLVTLAKKGASQALEEGTTSQVFTGIGRGGRAFAVGLVESIPALFEADTWIGLFDLGVMVFVLNHRLILPDDVVREQEEKLKLISEAIGQQIAVQWEAAKAQGKETEQAAKWATQGVLEVASMFIGIGEVKAALTATKVGSKLALTARLARLADDAAGWQRFVAATRRLIPDRAETLIRHFDEARIGRTRVPDEILDGLSAEQWSRLRQVLKSEDNLILDLLGAVERRHPGLRHVYGLTERLQDAWVRFCRDKGIVAHLRPSTRKAGRAPKPELIKAKTADELDALIGPWKGADAEDVLGDVVLIKDPKRPSSVVLDDPKNPVDFEDLPQEVKEAIDDRIAFRRKEYETYHGDFSSGKLDGVADLSPDGRVLSIDPSKPGHRAAFTGDVDAWAFYDEVTGELVTGARYKKLVAELISQGMIEHGAQLNWWTVIYKADDVGVYVGVVDKSEVMLQVSGKGFRQVFPGGRRGRLPRPDMEHVPLGATGRATKPTGWSKLSTRLRVGAGAVLAAAVTAMVFSFFGGGSDEAGTAASLAPDSTVTLTSQTEESATPIVDVAEPATSSSTTTTRPSAVAATSTTTTTTPPPQRLDATGEDASDDCVDAFNAGPTTPCTRPDTDIQQVGFKAEPGGLLTITVTVDDSGSDPGSTQGVVVALDTDNNPATGLTMHYDGFGLGAELHIRVLPGGAGFLVDGYASVNQPTELTDHGISGEWDGNQFTMTIPTDLLPDGFTMGEDGIGAVVSTIDTTGSQGDDWPGAGSHGVISFADPGTVVIG